MIACSDFHLGEKTKTNLRCRSETPEEWMDYQRNRLKWIVEQANRDGEDLYIAGDIFDKALSPSSITTMFIEEMNKLFGTCYIMPGNHCLPNHSMKEMYKSSYGTLNAMAGNDNSKIRSIEDSPYAFVPYDDPTQTIGNRKSRILFIHRLVFASVKDMPPGDHGIAARDLLNEYPDYDLLICGDNHTRFIKEIGGRTVLNCGCVTKRAIDFQDKELAIYHVDEKTFDIEVIPIPDDSLLIEDSYVEAKKESEEKFKDLVVRLQETGAMTLDYVENLVKGLDTIGDGAQGIIRSVV